MKNGISCLLLILFSVSTSFAQDNKYFDFDGFDDYAQINRFILPQDTDFTVEFFYSVCGNNSDFVFFDNRSAINGKGITLSVNGQDSVVLSVQPNSDTLSRISIGKLCSPSWGSDGHIAIVRTFSDSIFKVYINGNKEFELKSEYSDPGSVLIGKSVDSTGNPFVGKMDEIRFSNKARYTANFTVDFDFFISDINTLAYWNADAFIGDTIFYDLSSNGKDLIGKNGLNILTYIDSNQDYGLCRGSEIVLDAGGGSMFNWSPSEHLSSTTTRYPLCNSDTNINYQVVIGHMNGCPSDTSIVNVSILELPTVNVTPGDTTFCKNDTAWLTASGAKFYTWIPTALFTHPSEAYTGATPADTTVVHVIGRDINFCADTVFVKLNVMDCSKSLATINLTAISVYPNPTSGILNFDLPVFPLNKVEVYDVSGRQVFSSDVSSSVDLSHLESGPYVIYIMSEDLMYYSQFIKQ